MAEPASVSGRLARLRAMNAPLALAVAVGSLMVVVNFVTVLWGTEQAWLAGVDLVLDLAVFAAGLVLVVLMRRRSETESARMQALLEEHRSRLAAILDSAMDAIVTVNEQQTIVLFNRAAERVFRCHRDEAIGAPLERFIPPRLRAEHRARVAAFAASGAANERMGEDSPLWAVRANGEEFPIEVSLSHTTSSGKRYFTIIVHDITRRRRNEEALRRQQQELRELSARVFEAREEEKTIIARELHDELGQLLTALKMDLAWLRERLPRAEAELGAKAQQMNAMLDRTVGSVRRISADLRPLMLDDLGLADAAQWLVEDFARRSRIECRLDLDADAAFETVERPAATAVYRALQESLTNIARHSGAKHARVVLGMRDGLIELEIEDDGRGIELEDITKARSLGLKGMRERVHYLGGTLEIARVPRGGTRVKARVPVRAEREASMQ